MWFRVLLLFVFGAGVRLTKEMQHHHPGAPGPQEKYEAKNLQEKKQREAKNLKALCDKAQGSKKGGGQKAVRETQKDMQEAVREAKSGSNFGMIEWIILSSHTICCEVLHSNRFLTRQWNIPPHSKRTLKRLRNFYFKVAAFKANVVEEVAQIASDPLHDADFVDGRVTFDMYSFDVDLHDGAFSYSRLFHLILFCRSYVGLMSPVSRGVKRTGLLP